LKDVFGTTMILLSTSQSFFIAMCQPSPVGQVFRVKEEKTQPPQPLYNGWEEEGTRRRPIRKKPSVKTWKNNKIEASPAVNTRSVPPFFLLLLFRLFLKNEKEEET
jgi:hypothetical protein